MIRYTAARPNIETAAKRVSAPGLHLTGANRLDRLASWLKQVAARGEICPSNADIAERFHTTDAKGSEMLKALEARGDVSVERFQRARIVTITADGSKTMAVACRTPRVDSNAKRRRRSAR